MYKLFKQYQHEIFYELKFSLQFNKMLNIMVNKFGLI